MKDFTSMDKGGGEMAGCINKNVSVWNFIT
jgi:hypothetical protein